MATHTVSNAKDQNAAIDEFYQSRILRLADHLDAMPDHQFSMNWWLEPTDNHGNDKTNVIAHDCETVGCIAGHAVLLLADPGPPDNPDDDLNFDMDFATEAQTLLGLDHHQAAALFMPSIENGLLADYSNVTNSHAAVTLRNMAATGKVDWSHVPA